MVKGKHTYGHDRRKKKTGSVCEPKDLRRPSSWQDGGKFLIQSERVMGRTKEREREKMKRSREKRTELEQGRNEDAHTRTQEAYR